MNVALILSGGTGVRLGADIPKQYIEAGGMPVIGYCIAALSAHAQIDALHIVADEAWHSLIGRVLEKADKKGKFRGFSVPGENRQLSILHGLEDIRNYAGDQGYVLIHDAARPLLTSGQISDCLKGAAGHDGAMPALPMKDTVYVSRDRGRSVASLIDRGMVYAGQAPEVFRIGRYYEANRKLLPEEIYKINGSTEPAVLDGMDIVMIPGDEGNFKITTAGDLRRFREMVERGVGGGWTW